MKRIFIILAIAAPVLLNGCSLFSDKASQVPNIIYDTDVGNDIDDTEGLDLLYKFMDEGKVNLLGICLNKKGELTAKFVDIMSKWYGYPDIPVGLLRTDAPTGNDAEQCYTGKVCAMTNEDGTPVFETNGWDYAALPDPNKVYRKLLAAAPNHSVTIVSVGFFTNLANLLDTPGDEYSPLDGRELVKKKVKMLSLMAGRFKDEVREYNVRIDIPSSQKIMAEWPSEMVFLPWELGEQVHYPAESIENDFNWTPAHPLKEAYIRYREMPYDNWMYDPMAVVFGAGYADLFTLTEPGVVDVDDKGITRFHADPKGKARYATLTDDQCTTILAFFKEYLTRKPACKQ